MKERIVTPHKTSILWVNFILLDLAIHKAAYTDILQEFSTKGYKSSLITARSNKVPQIKNRQARIILIPLKRIPLVLPAMYAILMFFFLPIYILIFSPDFIIMEPNVHILSAFPTVLISRIKKIKIVLDVRSIPVETVGLRGYLEKFWFFVSIVTAKKLFDGMTILTPLMKKEICNNFGIDSTKIGVWTSGVSVSLFNPENLALKSLALKRKIGLSGKFVVFYHGVFTATRGLEEAIEAIKLLKPKYPDIVFFLLGNGYILNRLKGLIQREGLQENVILANSVDHSEVPKFIGMCDIGIVPLPNHPYWRFQSPLKLLEYLAMEKVVILTDIPAHRAVIGEAKCGIFISSIDSMEIAGAIEYAYLNKEYLEGWGKIGRELVEEKYTWEKVAKDLEKYLFSIDELKKE